MKSSAPDFEGLSPRAFEQMVQALCVQVLGPGLVVFGDGADGGREATFEGKVPYPSEADCWDGYIVIQAKFKQNPFCDVRDVRWLAAQLEDELDKFRDAKKKLRRPDYYILVTNIKLSAKPKQGGKAKIDAVFAKFARKLRIKSHSVWDYNNLCAFLSSNSDIRRTFAAWITSGDVISALMGFVRFSTPNFSDVIYNYMQKELLADQFVNLEQAGHVEEERTPLARVFVDLPISLTRHADPPESKDSGCVGAVSLALRWASQKLNPSTIRPAGPERAIEPQDQIKPRMVMVGGPGQGKEHCRPIHSAIVPSELT